MKTKVIIVAAGMGRRLKSKVPKAFVLLKNRPLLTYSLRIFNRHPKIDGLVVVGVKKYLGAFEKLAFPFKKVHAVVAGGATRADSVKCGLKALQQDTDIVLVHDAARPLVDGPMIDRLLAALRKNQAAIVGVPVKSTVKKVLADGYIEATLARDSLWEAQTPQGFHKDILVKAHAGTFKGEATDDAVLAERLGIKVKMVIGNYLNIKITTPEDMVTARQWL